MTGKAFCFTCGVKLIDIIKAYKKMFCIELKKSDAFFKDFNEIEVKLILENISIGEEKDGK
ncbi:MAG: hypothetical protein Ta2B_14400 [Termitinemataceae bacterium]|nr:MAG: hypothetical protein Ta2B_14400 [Termitinemataceae bacterium]